MAKLTAKARKKLPAKAFAGAGRSYPVEDAAHARDALGRATQQLNKGNLTLAQAQKIRAKAYRRLGK